MQVRWDSESAATPMGQLAFFIVFLTLTGLWSRWQEGIALDYRSANAPSRADVLGTWMLSILSGHKRYAHVTAIRCDGVNPGLLGMNKVISEDALRRALAATAEAEGIAWRDAHLNACVAALLDAPWILDIDTTVKALYGKQEGAVISPTTRRNRGVLRIPITPTSWPAPAWCSAPRSRRAMRTPAATVCPGR